MKLNRFLAHSLRLVLLKEFFVLILIAIHGFGAKSEAAEEDGCTCHFSRFCVSSVFKQVGGKVGDQVVDNEDRRAEKIAKKLLSSQPRIYENLTLNIASERYDSNLEMFEYSTDAFELILNVNRHGKVLTLNIMELILKSKSRALFDFKERPRGLDLRFSRIFLALWKGLALRVEKDPSVQIIRIQGLNIINPGLSAALESYGFEGPKRLHETDLFGSLLKASYLKDSKMLMQGALFHLPKSLAYPIGKAVLSGSPAAKPVMGIVQLTLFSSIQVLLKSDIKSTPHGSWVLQVVLPNE